MNLRKGPNQSERRIRASSAELDLPAAGPIREDYKVEGTSILRQVHFGSNVGPWMEMEAPASSPALAANLAEAWDQALLQGGEPRSRDASHGELRVVDLFAGCGAMSLGLKYAAEALGYQFVSSLAAEFNEEILGVYSANLRPKKTLVGDLAKAVEYECHESPTEEQFKVLPELKAPEFFGLKNEVDVLIGGPPCQGHSDLNNHSRRNDPKNTLYMVMPALAYCLKPKAVIVENVRAVIHDKNRVVQRTRNLLKGMGYHVDDEVVLASSIGVPQKRRRHFLVAVKEAAPAIKIAQLIEGLRGKPRTVKWALAGLKKPTPDSIFDTPSKLSERNKKRIEWLFKYGKHDLPDHRRPSCHKDKEHSYKSMYGRMREDEPAQTITSGFGSPGQGRFIHPWEPRLITPHEAARLQFFPDSFHFVDESGAAPKRTRLAEMIGNAVPPKLAYALGLGVLGAIY